MSTPVTRYFHVTVGVPVYPVSKGFERYFGPKKKNFESLRVKVG